MTLASIISQAYKASGITRTCARALDGEAPEQPGDDGAVAATLEVVRGMFDEIIDGLEVFERDNPSLATQRHELPTGGAPVALVTEWRTLSARWKATAAALAPDDAEGPEIEALSEQVEALCKRIAISTPTTQADCAALIQWVLEDGAGGILDPMHTVVQRKVADFLSGAHLLQLSHDKPS